MKDVRPRMVSGAARLLAQKGLQGASFSEVLELTGAPRGSVYHHFPNGKDELVAAALDAVSAATLQRLGELDRTPVAITEGFLALWSDLLDRAKLTAGCAVVAVSVAATGDLLDHAGTVFSQWTSHLADLLIAAGLTSEAATDFATLLISATEGAVIMSRAQRSREPFDRIGRLLTAEAQRLLCCGGSDLLPGAAGSPGVRGQLRGPRRQVGVARGCLGRRGESRCGVVLMSG